MFLYHFWILVLMFFIATCCSRINGFWFFSCPHGNGKGQAGDVCSAFCQCHPLNTCEAGVQKCAPPGMYGDRCHLTRPCATGFSCHPGVQKCFHVPRLHGEPCVAGYECGRGLSCEPGVQLCFYHPRQYNEPCSAGFSCALGLSCQPGYQRCLHHPRRENEHCSAGYACADGLDCRLCDEPYATCQMSRVPAMTEQDYDRPFNKVAFLVTHNSFSNSPNFAVWARNQRLSVSQQLKDGVRGLMLDIYPGWGEAEVRLCHASCFWSGSTNLLDTLIEIRKFLESNTREVITIIFEDYLKNPTILKRVFDQAGISPYVLLKDNWSDGFSDWPTLRDMRRLGRVVVFNNNGLRGFPYTEFNMWFYVRENRYGNPGLNVKECIDRAESRWNAGWSDHWSLVLVNWFSTAANPLEPCLNSFKEIKQKLGTCHDRFGLWANFVAVNFYTEGSGGGAFQAVKWLNGMLKRDNPVTRKRKASIIPFPLIDTVSHRQAEQNTTDEAGYGKGFHTLSDIISHIFKHRRTRSGKTNNAFVNSDTTSSASTAGLHSHTVPRVTKASGQLQGNIRNNLSHQINEPMFQDFVKNDTFSMAHNQLITNRTKHRHDVRKISLSHVSPFAKGKGDMIHNVKSSKLSNRLSVDPGHDLRSKNSTSIGADRSPNTKTNFYHFFLTDGDYRVSNLKNQSLSTKFIRDKRRKIRQGRPPSTSGLRGGSERQLAPAVTKATQVPFPPTVRLSPRTHGHQTIGIRVNSSTKIRNLRRQLARIKAKLDRYLRLGHPRKRKTPSLVSLKSAGQ